MPDDLEKKSREFTQSDEWLRAVFSPDYILMAAFARQVRSETVEESCKAMCGYCRGEFPETKAEVIHVEAQYVCNYGPIQAGWVHQAMDILYRWCDANPIRKKFGSE